MKTAVLYLSVLGCALALPNGYYHQEYNYKTSASSYKNNELQHKTDDQGYYRKDGDLEGRVKPRIDSNSEHSEYVNPNLRTGQYIGTGGYGGLNTDLSSYGNVRAENAYGGYGTNLNAEGIAQTDHITGSRGAYSATSGAYGSNSYGSNTYGTGSYGASSNLRLITSRIQQELERDLPNIIRQNNAYSQSRVDISELERELRRNLTERIEKEISNRYGQQGIRGGMSYTIADGRLQTTANYDNQELTDLRRQLESNLLNQLRTEYNRYGTSSNSRYETQQSYNYGYTSTTIRPIYHTIYPSLPTYRTTIRPYYPANTHANYQVIDTNSRYTPVSNPESITNIASTIQTQMDTRLNELLDEVYRKYFSSSSSYSLTNTDVVLERLKNELRSNLTYLIDENIRRNYGTQIQRDGYMYSVGSGGQSSTGYNYALRDLENLKSQIETNLIGKLTRDFEIYKTRWSSQHSVSASSNYGSYSSTPRYDYYSTPRYEVYNVPRYETHTTPSSYVYYPGSLTKGGTSSSLNYVSGSRQSGYEIQGRNNMAQLQRQLQDELSRKLQSAISSGHYSTYSTSGSYNPQSYQTSLQQLSDDLNRNLTRQLQEYSASGTYSAYGNFNSAQMESLRSQLQASLMRQLQQGLQQSYQASSSYSASSSSGTNYRPVRGFSYQGQYKSGIDTMGEDCVGDYTNAYSTRLKRSYQPYRSRAIGLGTSGFGRQHSYWDSRDSLGGYPYGRVQSQAEIGHQTDSFGLTQQTEISSNGKLHQGSHQTELEHQDLGQQIDDSDLTQQVEDTIYSNLQQIDDSDFNQQAEDSSFEKLQVHGHQTEVRPQPHNSNQHLVDIGYRKPSEIRNVITIGKLERGLQQISDLLIDSNISQKTEGEVGQQIDGSDLNQQIEDSNYGSWQQRKHQLDHGQQIDHSVYGKLHAPQQAVETGHQTQQEDTGYGKLQSNQEQVELGQNLEDAHLTQHEQHIDGSHPTRHQDTGYGKLQSGQQQVEFGQNLENSDLTQHEQQIDVSDSTQHEDIGYGKLQSGQQQIQFGQSLENSDLTQHEQHIDTSHPTQREDTRHGKLQSSHQQIEFGQNIENADLTQHEQHIDASHPTQHQDKSYGKLQSSQQQVEVGQNLETSDLTQHEQQIDVSDSTQNEDIGYGKLQSGQQQIEFGQNLENADLTQHEQHIDASHPTQREDTRHGKLQSSHQQIEFGQNIENADLTQHEQHIDASHPTQDTGYGQLQSSQQQVGFEQNLENSDLTQHEQQIDEDTRYGKLQSGQQQIEFGQNLENADLTQHEQHIDASHPTQREDTRHGKLQSSQQQIEIGQNIENADLTQHEQHIDASHPTQHQDTSYGKLQSSQQQVEVGQNLENSDFIQHEQQIDVADSTQHEVTGYGKLQSGQQQIEFGQNIENADLTQHEQHIDASHPTQREDTGYGNLQPGQQQIEFGQNLENADLTQHEQHIDVSDTTQHEDTRYGKLHSGQQQTEFGQNLENSDLAQHEQHIDVTDTTQQEDTGYGKLQSGQEIEPGQKIEDSGKLNRSPAQQIQQTEDLSSQKFQGQRQNSLEQNIDSSFTEQTEDSQYGQQVEHSGLFQNNNDLGHGKLQTDGQQIQQLDYSSVTQKVEKSPSLQSLGSSRDIQQIENSDFENGVPRREFNSGISQKDKSLWSQDQLKMADMIKDGISKELKATVSSVYNVCRLGTGTCHLSTIYKNIQPELENHIREELEISIGNSVNINELRKLQEDLETDLKLLLQKEIENAQRSLRQNENLDFDQQQISEQQNLEQGNQEERFREQPGKLEIGQHAQQETDTILHQPNTLIGSSTNPEIDLTHIDQSPIPQPQIPSHNLHTTSKSVTQKSLTINEFLQQEIEHQERDLQNQKTNEQSQPQLPSLKQVIDEEISDDGDDQRTEIPGTLTGNKNIIPQNVADDQLQELDGINNEQNNNQEVIRGAQIPSDQISSNYPSEGQSFGVTSQGQIITQPQSKIDAENTADSLVSILRAAQRNRQSQQEGNIPSNSHHHIPEYQEASNVQEGQGTYSSPGTNIFGGYGESRGIRRNNYGSHISQNTIDKQYTIHPDSNQQSSSDYWHSRGPSSTYEHHRIRGSGHHHQHYGHSESRPLSKYGHQNIDENAEQGNSHRGSRPSSNYGPQYTDESNVQHGYSHSRPRPSSTYSRQYVDKNVQHGSSLDESRPSSNYNRQYIEENVQTSNTGPHHQGLANAPENSEPSRNINGVKGSYGHRGYHYNQIVLTTEHPALTHKIQTQSEAISPPQPPQETHIEPEIVSVTEENLPWWKKLGNTVKQGAHDLKAKIIGSN